MGLVSGGTGKRREAEPADGVRPYPGAIGMLAPAAATHGSSRGNEMCVCLWDWTGVCLGQS